MKNQSACDVIHDVRVSSLSASHRLTLQGTHEQLTGTPVEEPGQAPGR